MKTVLRTVGGCVVALGLFVSIVSPAFAGYGNHAERATANIQTRVGIAKTSIETQLAEIQAVAERKVPTP
jgi:hypothetical protein